jgi:5,5'-dehydrodivanillate O-demethylase
MENSVDPAHLEILHQTIIGQGRKPVNTTRGFVDEVDHYEFEITSYGILKNRTYKNGQKDSHPLVFPNILRQGKMAQYRVPIDDTHTFHLHIVFEPTPDGSVVEEDESPKVIYVDPYKEPAKGIYPFANFSQGMKKVIGQDHMAWETQGPIADRTRERLSTSDRGIILFRELLKENINKVKEGKDPMGVMRDPNHEMIDTKLAKSLNSTETRGRPIAGTQTTHSDLREL